MTLIRIKSIAERESDADSDQRPGLRPLPDRRNTGAREALVITVCRQFVESPDLAFTLDQVATRLGLVQGTCGRVLAELVDEGALTLQRRVYRLTLNGWRAVLESKEASSRHAPAPLPRLDQPSSRFSSSSAETPRLREKNSRVPRAHEG